LEMISLNDLERAINNMKKFIDCTTISTTDYLLRRKDGTEFWGRVRSRLIKKGGRTVGVEGIISDITKDKEFKETIKESEEKFRTITEQSLMGIAIIQDNKVVYVNAKFANILGYTIDELRKLPPGFYKKLIHPEDIDFVVEQARKKQSGDKDAVYQYIYRLLNKHGETIWVENYSKTINYGGKLADLVMVIDITDKQKADQELKESEEKFREISEQSLMGICILQDNVIKYVNQKFADIIGYSIEEMMDWAPSEYIKTVHPDDRRKTIEQAVRKQHGHQNIIINYQTRAIRKTGESIWLDIYSKTILYRGNFADLVMVTDITDRMTAEQKIKESEEKYRLITENVNDMISVLNRKLEYEYLNEETFYQLMGYKKKDMLGKSVIEFIHPDDLQNAINIFKNVFKTGEADCKLRTKKKDGEYIWLEVKGKIFYDANGEKKALIVSRDISSRIAFEEVQKNYMKDLEKEVKRKTRDLLSEKKKVETIINAISDGILVLSPEGKLLLTNAILQDYYHQIYNADISEDFSFFSNPKNIFEETVRKLFLSKKAQSITIQPEEGKFLQFVSMFNPESYDSFLGSIIEVRDVTPFVEFDNMRRHFVSTVTHELRTPISAIIQSIENLEDYKDRMSEKIQNKLMDSISQNIRLLSELVDDLLLVSRIEERKIQLAWEKYYPLKLVKEVIEQAQPRVCAKNINIELEVDEKICLYGDIKRISQIFRILIDNAIKYSNTQTNIKIRVLDQYKGKFNLKNIEGVLIQFCDSGIGIRKEDQPHLFKRFFRAEEVRHIPGTGLGLSIAKELTQLHHGEIFVESEPGKGSTFSIFLPRLKENPLINYK
ncbi:MAG: PAS domain S-box protein, partial [Candidatus Helarchaeota archaeon]